MLVLFDIDGLGLLTGNYQPIARLKLARAGADAVARNAAELRSILAELGIGGPVSGAGGARAAERAPTETSAT